MAETETVLTVTGMTCSNCVRHVNEALRELDGVQSVAVELQQGEVKVAHDTSRAPLERLLHALDEAGYPARARQ